MNTRLFYRRVFLTEQKQHMQNAHLEKDKGTVIHYLKLNQMKDFE